jgi:hypothetical protein
LSAPASLAPRWWRSRTLELGVPADERERILQRFTLPDGGTTRRAGRVGLYIARQLATSQGGELTTTKAAAGARYELRLALLGRRPPAADRQRQPPASPTFVGSSGDMAIRRAAANPAAIVDARPGAADPV